MKNLCDPSIDRYRNHEADRYYQTKDSERAYGGAFMVPAPHSRNGLRRHSFIRVIASSGKDQTEDNFKWDHVSASLPDRCPTWEEMDYLKRLFFKPDEVCFQLHMPPNENISNHPYCLHIWRPLEAKIPLPPSIMVGFQGLELKP
jgi:hypothetical protein